MFKDLQDAIDNIFAFKDEGEAWSRVPTYLIEDLKKIANTYFVEPEDDKEFEEWKTKR